MKFITIGRSPENIVFIDNETVSRRHAELLVTRSGELYLTDCASTGGTYVHSSEGWTPIRQSFVGRSDSVKFGQIETTIDYLLSI